MSNIIRYIFTIMVWCCVLICPAQNQLQKKAEATRFLNVDANKMKICAENRPRFQSLLKRFTAGDTTLTVEEVRDIYYGFAYTKNYNINGDKTPEADSALKNLNYKKALDLYQNQLRKSPVCATLTLKMFGLVSYLFGDKDVRYGVYQRRMKMLSEMLYQTGNGLSAQTAFKINWISDEYYLLNAMYCQRILSESVNTEENFKGNIMTVIINGRQRDIYFDLSRYFEVLDSTLTK